MMKLSIAVILCMACTCFAQKQNTTPVPILKQINRHNEDGSYSYGYEAADGSFKIETKSATGEVKGKYGYVDAEGTVREISYGADQHGFNPEGTDINVPPRTIHAENDNRYPALAAGEIDDGQYREDPNIYLDPKYNTRPSSSKASSTFRINAQPAVAKPFSKPSQNFNYQTTSAPIYEEPQQPLQQTKPQSFFQNRYQAPAQNTYQAPAQNNYYQPPQQQNYYQQPSNNYYQPKNNYNPAPVNIFAGHPAQNFDVFSGSYTIQY